MDSYDILRTIKDNFSLPTEFITSKDVDDTDF
jgi:hypothetical protein